jgi:hypothetical protein
MIVVECNTDELFIKTMGFARKEIHHAGNKGNVIKKVRKLKKAVGIIDEDPHSEQPGELKNYETAQKKKTIELLKKKNDKDKFLIQISPDLEHWILSRAKVTKINPQDFSIPGNPKELHRLTRVKKNLKLINFLSKLVNSDSEIKIMREWIKSALK